MKAVGGEGAGAGGGGGGGGGMRRAALTVRADAAWGRLAAPVLPLTGVVRTPGGRLGARPGRTERMVLWAVCREHRNEEEERKW